MENDEQVDLVNFLTKESLRRCFRRWGIEGSLEKIHELCKNEAMKECFIRNFYEMTGLRRCH
jgi:hypothetical protein